MSALPRIAVVIPTTCEARREHAIRRAVEGALAQEGVDVSLVMVVNGQRFDPALLESLMKDPRIAVHRLEEPSYPAACRHGRSLVATEYFAYLDDDDEFLPNALATRVAPMLADPSVGFVATNGYLEVDGHESVAYAPSARIEHEPLEELLRANWLQPCGNLFRSASVTLEDFDGKTKYYEWTLLAFKLSQRLRLRFLDVPTYRKHDSSESLYKSAGVTESAVTIIDMLSALNTRPSLRPTLARLRGAALHTVSDFNRVQGNSGKAWKYHLESLMHPHGWRYLPYTRHLLLPVTRANTASAR
ncbi:MAG: glycosyltransferase family 2 protein [bacterium]